ncbi:MAG TPA: bifunctional transcriptional activator/DNA repair enzyme protein Ada, partial [Chloroflexota bacterium]|nr:bifunctional transcriptional activator/DNA repair enzyme protein Ada [Chloroflexota bacterium]
MRPRYLITDCWLGRLLVAGTERGLSVACMGDDDSALLAELQSHYPTADLQPHDPLLQQWAEALLEHLEGRRTDLDLPLDVPATR